MTDHLHARGKALEDIFFAERDRKLIEAMREKAALDQTALDLAQVTGVADSGVLHVVAALGVSPETLAAFSLVPLLHVAWSDTLLDTGERDAILVEAVNGGVFRGSAAYALLEGWLTRAPEPELYAAWKAYHAALAPKLSEAERAAFKASLMERARRIARASGGLFGLGSVSADETEAIRKLEELLG